MLLIADSSALIALSICDGLVWLDHLFGTVHVPPAVYTEVTSVGKPESQQLKTYLQDKVTPLKFPPIIITDFSLGAGEIEAMTLYKQESADWLLVDDFRARKIATLNGIQIVGSVGVMLRAKECGLTPALKPLLDRLNKSGIYIASALIEQILLTADE